MKQLARRASLVVMLVLATVGTASADQWVLWRQTTVSVFAPDGGRPDAPALFSSHRREWEIERVESTKDGCESRREAQEHLHRHDAGSRADGPVVRDGALVALRSTTFQCIPDTIDPRGPKGGTR
jgi:hypothetical protein